MLAFFYQHHGSVMGYVKRMTIAAEWTWRKRFRSTSFVTNVDPAMAICWLSHHANWCPNYPNWRFPVSTGWIQHDFQQKAVQRSQFPLPQKSYKTIPYAPCMQYLPTFALKITQFCRYINIPYMEHMGIEKCFNSPPSFLLILAKLLRAGSGRTEFDPSGS